MTVQRKQNIAGYTDSLGRFRPIRSPQFVGSPERKATRRVKSQYSRAKAGDLGKRRQERALEDVFDREIRLMNEAEEAKRRDRERLERSIEKDIYGEADERSKGKTLAQFVRASGGIRVTKGDRGELEYLSQKESGRRGLIAKLGGKSLDGMFQAARESGYNVQSMDDLIDRLVAEAKGGKPMYKTHGYLDYRTNPSELRVMQITPKTYGVFLRKYLLKRFRTKAAAETYAASIRARVKKNPATAAKLAKAAIAIFDTDLDLDLDTRDVRRLGVGAKRLRGKKTNPSVASEILAQLGGNKFVAMTGAKNFGTTGRNLSFRLPARFAKNGINYVIITLRPDDTYDVEYGKTVKYQKKVIHVSKGIYFDMLRRDFTDKTGLDTSLGTMGKKNPIDPVGLFANAAVGIASALQIKEYMNRPKRKTPARRNNGGTIPAKRRKAAINPAKRTPKAKTNPRSARKVGTARSAAGPKGHFLMPFIDGVYLTDGESLGRKFKTQKAAREYAQKMKIRLVNPPAKKPSRKSNGIISRAIARNRAGRAFKKELRQKAALDRTRARKRKLTRAAANPSVFKWERDKSKDGEAFYSAILNGKLIGGVDKNVYGEWFVWGNAFTAIKNKGGFKTAASAKKYIERAVKLVSNAKKTTPRSAGVKKAVARSANPKGPYKFKRGDRVTATNGPHKGKTFTVHQASHSLNKPVYTMQEVVVTRGVKSAWQFPESGLRKARKANPKTTAKRRTYEMFQGRPASMVRPLPVSRFAPARMDQLGDLIEIKLADGQLIKPNPKRFKLCAAGGKLWIAGGTFAKPNPAGQANELNPVEKIVHVVYGTRKPHHGDHKYTQYIHRLGEDSGHLPTLAVDREGFPIIRGGKYKIEAKGIVN